MIKAAVFDCFGVLTAVDSWRIFVEKLTPEQQVMAHQLNIAVNSGQITIAEFSLQLNQHISVPASFIDQIFAGHYYKNTLLIQYIKDQKQLFNLKIGLLSNVANDWITTKLLDAQEAEVFDVMVLSYQVQMVKPDPKIFQLTLDRLGVSANQAVLIDDNQSYCRAAQDLGWRTINYVAFEPLKEELEAILADNSYL